MDNKNKMICIETAMRWYGWGSPVGLGIFIICLAFSSLIVVYTISSLIIAK